MSADVKSIMLTNIKNYFAKVKAKTRPIIYSQVTIGPSGTHTYDITTVLSDHASYDLRSCKVNVLLLNTESGATKDMYINSTMTIVHGINAAGKVAVTNYDNKAVDVLVTVDYPSIKK